MPYHKIAYISTSAGIFLLAASASTLLVNNVNSGKLTDQWTVSRENDAERPMKKQKTEAGSSTNNIVLLQSHQSTPIFVATTEDKSIHVLELDKEGRLNTLSQRCMPKRPCAIQILPEEQLILCADKFGDVYSLPLFPDPDEDAKFAQATEEPKSFKPSATDVTVHTKRNLKALEAQQSQKSFTPRKGPLAFEHKVLLGHVSMLTDMVYIKEGTRGRIITADRDEHIRISRGPTQAYVIEGYCLGSTEFVSKLCSIPDSSLVVTGGGDDWLGVWDWKTYELLDKIDMKQALIAANIVNPDKLGKISVSNIKHLRCQNQDLLIVICERMQAILTVLISKGQNSSMHVQPTEHIPIDMAAHGESVVVSFDVRKATSMRLTHYKPQRDTQDKIMLVIDTEQNVLDVLNDWKEQDQDDTTLDLMLYNVSTLRKRGGWDEPQPDEED